MDHVSNNQAATIRNILRSTRGRVSMGKHAGQWTIYGPNWSHRPDGPQTTKPARDYRHAQCLASAWRSRVCLAMLDRLSAGAIFAISDAAESGKGSVRQLVRIGLQNSL